MRTPLALLILLVAVLPATSQILTREDSLNANLDSRDNNTYISGYGELKAEYDFRNETASANATRCVLFVGHRFSNKISFFSELEFEDAKLEGGESGGELALEQFYLRFGICKNAYLAAGLFTPRIGIMNENHLPTTFNGNDRPYVERFVIPATWREIGLGIYGSVDFIKGLNYSAALVNGLNAEGFENGTGIRGGRFEGSDASASCLALTGSLVYYLNNFRFQASGYYGGSAGLNKRDADSLQLESGAFGTPVSLVEADVQYFGKLFSFRVLAAQVNIPEAQSINRAYNNNTPESVFGGYVEASVNLLYLFNREAKKTLALFGRYETMDLNQSIPSNGIKNDINKKDYVVAGLTFKPLHGVTLKADYVFRKTGNLNTETIVNPSPQAPPFYTENTFFNLGFGYSF